MLRFLLDAHVHPAVAVGITSVRPEIPIWSIHDWNEGIHADEDDDAILIAAREPGLTLVTSDQRTIPDLLARWAVANEPHAGIIFVSRRTIAQQDVGGLVRALIALWDRHGALDWSNRLAYLQQADV